MPRPLGPLTPKQTAVLEYVKSCIENNNRTPTIRDTALKFKYSSTGSVREIFMALVRKGELIKDESVARGVRLNPKKYSVKVVRKK
jgi:repressor LexA